MRRTSSSKRPAKLYKYERASLQTLSNLKAQVLYFGTPRDFNDPFECEFEPELVPLEGDERRQVLDRWSAEARKAGVSATELAELDAKTLEENAKQVLIDTLAEFRQKFGVTCFSEVNDNPLMWSHYADHHRGLCLEFSTESDSLEKVFKVIYSSSVPRFRTFDLLVGQTPGIDELLGVKSSDWSYEKEWRAVHAESRKEYHYRSSDLTGVYFGARVDPRIKEVVLATLKAQNPTVKFWQGRLSTQEFKVLFKQHDYMTHLEAVAAGRMEQA